MIIEKIIFNFIALFFFIYTFFSMIKKNDTSYVVLLILQAIGITINLFEIVFKLFNGVFGKFTMYFTSIFIPIIIICIEKKGVTFLELKNICIAKIYLLFKNSKYAKKYLSNIVAKYPNSYKAHKMLAEIYEKEGGMRKAIDEYVIAVDIRKKDYLSYYRIGYLLAQLNQKKEATTILNNLLKSKPDYYEASILLGDILMQSDNYKEAINIYTLALKFKPNDYNLYYNLGISYTLLNDFQNAKMCYEKAADINHILYNAYYTLGKIYLIYHDIEKAEEYFSKSLESDDLDAKAYFELAKIYMLKNEREKAIIFVNKAIELDKIIYKMVEKEPIFIPIRKYIILPVKDSEKKYKISELDEKVEIHLEKTFKLIEGMGIKGIGDNSTEKIKYRKNNIENKGINKEK